MLITWHYTTYGFGRLYLMLKKHNSIASASSFFRLITS